MTETSEEEIERALLKSLLTPSYVSATVAIGSILVLVGSALLSRFYWSSGWLASILQTVRDSNQHLLQFNTGAGDSPFNVVLLFLFWSCIGLAVYFVIIGIVHALGEARELGEEMNYVHTNRRAILTTFLVRTLVRGVGLVLLFVSVAVLFKVAIPYVIASIMAVTLSAGDILLVLLGVCILLLVLHMITVVMRAIALRPRLFSVEISE